MLDLIPALKEVVILGRLQHKQPFCGGASARIPFNKHLNEHLSGPGSTCAL